MEQTKLEIIINDETTETKIQVRQDDAYLLMSELIKIIIRLANAAHEEE